MLHDYIPMVFAVDLNHSSENVDLSDRFIRLYAVLMLYSTMIRFKIIIIITARPPARMDFMVSPVVLGDISINIRSYRDKFTKPV